MSFSSNRLENALALHRMAYSIIHHVPTFSSQTAAAAMHVPGKELAKSVVLEGKGRTYLAVLPASHQVDFVLFNAIVGERVRLASEAKIRELFPDCDLGAIPPLGELYGLPVYVDVSLALDREIVFPAGTRCDSVRMTYHDFETLARPEVCAFGLKPEGRHSKPGGKAGTES